MNEHHSRGAAHLILTNGRCTPEAFLEYHEDDRTLLHAAAESCDAELVSIAVEFVGSEAKRARESRHGFTPVEVYQQTRHIRLEPCDAEIISLLAPLPAKNAHE